jgi:hypothetical protein
MSRKTRTAYAATLTFGTALGSALAGAARNFQQGFSASVDFTIEFARSIRKTVTASVSFVGAAAGVRRLVRVFEATLSPLGNLSRSIWYNIQGVLMFSPTFGKRPNRVFTATISFIGNVSSVLTNIVIARVRIIVKDRNE